MCVGVYRILSVSVFAGFMHWIAVALCVCKKIMCLFCRTQTYHIELNAAWGLIAGGVCFGGAGLEVRGNA